MTEEFEEQTYCLTEANESDVGIIKYLIRYILYSVMQLCINVGRDVQYSVLMQHNINLHVDIYNLVLILYIYIVYYDVGRIV